MSVQRSTLRKLAAAGVFGAVVLGGGGTALALSSHTAATGTGSPSGSSSSTPSGGSSSGSSNKHKHHGKHGDLLQHALHATWTVKGKDGKVVTHDAIRGTVTAASGSAVTVKAADGVSETYKVTSSTKFKVRSTTKGKPTDGTASSVKPNQQAVVLGTGTGSYTATVVVVGGK